MRFRANIEHVQTFQREFPNPRPKTKRVEKRVEKRVSGLTLLYRDHTGHRETTETVYRAFYRDGDAYYLQRGDGGRGAGLVVSACISTHPSHCAYLTDTDTTLYTCQRQIKVDALFTDYRIQSNASNEINLLLSPEALLAALRSAAGSTEVVVKLAKKHGHAVLSFEIALALGGG
ncbi:hypothetical protein EW145_g3414, partial [Phellinidium pouzarii]